MGFSYQKKILVRRPDIHPRGVVIINPGKNAALLSIPKNASSSAGPALNMPIQSFSPEDFNKLPFRKIAILRNDPIVRLGSGISHLLGNFVRAPEFPKVLLSIIKKLEGMPWKEVDPHLRPQGWFLEGYKIDQFLNLENLTSEWRELGLPPLKKGHGRSNLAFRRPEKLIKEDPLLEERVLTLLNRK